MLTPKPGTHGSRDSLYRVHLTRGRPDGSATGRLYPLFDPRVLPEGVLGEFGRAVSLTECTI